MSRKSVVQQFFQRFRILPGRKDLVISETQKTFCDAADNGARLRFGSPVVEHVANDIIAGDDQAERARRRNAEVVHRFAAQELAD